MSTVTHNSTGSNSFDFANFIAKLKLQIYSANVSEYSYFWLAEYSGDCSALS